MQKIGAGCLGIGVVLFFLGVLMLLDRALLIMSNILILMSVVMLMGVQGFLQFVIQKDKLRGTVTFSTGIIFIFAKIPVVGIVLEVIGAYWLFGGMIPFLKSFLLKLPILSMILPFLTRQKEELPL